MKLVKLLALFALGASMAWACPANGTCEGKKMCDGKQKGQMHMPGMGKYYEGKMCAPKAKGGLVGSVHYALEKVGIAKEDWGDAKVAAQILREELADIGQGIEPLALKGETLDTEAFLALQAKRAQAKAEYLDTILHIVPADKHAQFVMLLSADAYVTRQRGTGAQMCDGSKTCDTKGNCDLGKKCR
ncbi:MAG: hypothetical protein KU28_01690 [Sulfurovum sp. PC08-66]|nr:MAG: hypothetical protein KU28_01690 [Sulfurovum sp. PC08-66]KIM12649.1 MAG: hypothetical protein KU37_01795 [Sulfuricurvum sp. PC08-66]